MITFTAIYFILLGFLFLAATAASIFIPAKTTAPSVNANVQLYLIFFNVLIVVLLFGTATGLFMKKNWARIATLIMSVFALFTGLLSSVVIFFVPMPQNAAVVKLFIVGFYFVFLVVMPGVFLITFTRAKTKEVFAGAVKPKSDRPIGITIMAYLMIISGVCLLPWIFTSIPMQIGPIVAKGFSTSMYCGVISIVSIFVGIGLLKLKKNAWAACIAYHSFFITLGSLNLLMINNEIVSVLSQRFPSSPFFTLDSFRIIMVLSLSFPAFLLWYLISRKKHFVN